MSHATREYERAKAALLAAGFSNSAAVELLCKRLEVRDRFVMAAIQGGYEVEEAFKIADACMERRNDA